MSVTVTDSAPTDRAEVTVAASTAEERPRLVRRVGSAVLTLLVIALAIYAWPARLGGASRLVVVTGDSMEPTYDFGDLVFTRDGGTPETGDAVVFEVPDGPADGLLVIHRILEIDEAGTITTRGDNRTTPDQWDLIAADVVGEPVLRVPGGGHVVWFLGQPLVIGLILFLLILALLWPRPADDEDDEHEPEHDGELVEEAVASEIAAREHEAWRLERPSVLTSAATVLVADDGDLRRRRRRIGEPADRSAAAAAVDDDDALIASWIGHGDGVAITPELMAEAQAWVDEQLASGSTTDASRADALV